MNFHRFGRDGADFYAGQVSYLGPHYILVRGGEALRVLIVPMEVGDAPAYVSMEPRSLWDCRSATDVRISTWTVTTETSRYFRGCGQS